MNIRALPALETELRLVTGRLGGQERDQRFRTFREGAFVANFLRNAATERFWLSELRRFYLFLYLIRESAWMRGGEAGRLPFALVAARSQLSLARLSQLLDFAQGTGDFVRRRDPMDARQYIFEPSTRAIALFERLVEDFHLDAQPLLPGAERIAPGAAGGSRARQLLFIDGMLRMLDDLDLGNRGIGSLSFMLAMLDLHLYSPLASNDVVRTEAQRLRVSCVTIRNLLRRAEDRDWLQRERRMLSLSPKGRRRTTAAMEAFELLAAEVLLGEGERRRDAGLWQGSTAPMSVQGWR